MHLVLIFLLPLDANAAFYIFAFFFFRNVCNSPASNLRRFTYPHIRCLPIAPTGSLSNISIANILAPVYVCSLQLSFFSFTPVISSPLALTSGILFLLDLCYVFSLSYPSTLCSFSRSSAFISTTTSTTSPRHAHPLSPPSSLLVAWRLLLSRLIIIVILAFCITSMQLCAVASTTSALARK